MKFIQFKFLVLIAIVGLFSGCRLLNQTSVNSNKQVNSSNTNKPVETPTTPPMVEPAKKVEPSNTPVTETNSNSTTENKSPKGSLGDKINQANFDRIKEGMSLEEVAKIFADQGMKISDMTINGRHSEMYMWSTDDMKKKIKVTFEKDKVVEKEKDGF